MRQSRHARSLSRDIGELVRHLVTLPKPACAPCLEPALSSRGSRLLCRLISIGHRSSRRERERQGPPLPCSLLSGLLLSGFDSVSLSLARCAALLGLELAHLARFHQ